MGVDGIPNPRDLEIAGSDLEASQALDGPIGSVLTW
jgi:hypothetical protein